MKNLKSESGASIIEYILGLLLVGSLVAASAWYIGENAGNVFAQAGGSISSLAGEEVLGSPTPPGTPPGRPRLEKKQRPKPKPNGI